MSSDSRDSTPLVSILLPIYNEELYIRNTLESIVSQEYQNLEILISDNCSSDSTCDICREFESKDKRIKYYQQDSNIGAGPNHIFLFGKLTGKYFIFAAGHDKWSNNYIAENVQALEGNISAVLSYGTPYWLDENDNYLNRFSGWYDTRGLSVASRFFIAYWGKPNPILGLFRREAFPSLDTYNFVGADMVLLCQLALEGEFIHTVNSSFFRRKNRKLENRKERLSRYVSDEMKITTSFLTSYFPLAKLPYELIKSVIFSSVKVYEKILILTILLIAIPVKFLVEK